MNARKRVFLCAMFLIASLITGTSVIYAQDSASQKMVSMLPDDVLFFAETSGGDALKPDFEKTIIGRMWNEPSVQTFYKSIEEQLMQRVQGEGEMSEAVGFIQIAKSVLSVVGSRPIIIGAAQKEAQDGPPIYGFAIIDAGTKKDAISGLLSNFEAMAPEGEIVDVKIGSNTFHSPKDAGDVPGYWGWVGNYFVFGINDGEGLAIKYINSRTERELPSYFKSSSVKNDALGIYINFEKTFGVIQTIASMEGNEEDIAIPMSMMSLLGFDKFKSVTNRIGFSGSEMVAEEVIEISQPITGIFASMKPVGIDIFNMVPSDAVSVTAMNFDAAALYDTMFNAMKNIAGEDFQEVERGIQQFEQQTQVKIREGLLESINGKVLFYQTPVNSSSMFGSYVFVVGLKNVELWNETIANITNIAAAMSNGMVQASSEEMNGRTFNTIAVAPLAMAQVIPTWTIVGENVVIGSNPTICSVAADQAAPAARADSIRSNENFQKATLNLPSKTTYVRYTDSKAQMTQIMALLQQLWPTATVLITEQTGIALPMVLPNLTNIIEDVTPSIQYTYFEENGIRSIYKGTGIEPSLGAAAGFTFGAGALMPALTRVRQIERRMVSGTNLSAIGKAMLIYANDYDDFYPPNLEILIEKSDLHPKYFESKRKPANFDGPTYIYITGQTTSDHPGNVLAYENPEYCSEGVNVLYIDSHVEFIKKEDFIEELEATYKRLKKPMPEIKFRD